MVKVKYSRPSLSSRIKGRMKFVFKTKLFKAAIALLVIGIVMIVASYVVQGTYYYRNDSSANLMLNSSSPQTLNVSQLSGAPLNITFIIPQDQFLHYRVFTVLHFMKNGVNVVYITNVTSGTAVNASVATVGTVYSPQLYYVELSTTSNSAYNVTVYANQAIPQHIPSNMYFGIPGGVVLVTGIVAMAISITRGFK